MFSGILGGLFIAWILSIFNFDSMFIRAVYEIFSLNISTDVYYVIFALIGLIGGIIKDREKF